MADYQAKLDDLNQAGIGVLALSVDPPDKARELVEQSRIEFPLAFGLQVPDDAERIGAWWDDKRSIIQPSEFILAPSKKIVSATYSTGPVGRLRVDDALALISHLASQRTNQ